MSEWAMQHEWLFTFLVVMVLITAAGIVEMFVKALVGSSAEEDDE